MARLREARLLWPTLLTLLGLAILITVGNWQMRRLAWKEALIEKVEARAKVAPVSLQAVLGIFTGSQTGNAAEAIEFQRVAVKGRFNHDQEFHVWNPGKAGPAWSVVTPFTLSTPLGAAGTFQLSTLLVIRGTVPDTKKAPASRSAGNLEGELELVGRVRTGHVGTFSSAENAAKNEWYEFDIEGMRRTVATALVDRSASKSRRDAVASVVPFYIEAETATGGPGGPQPELNKVNLTNRHLEYALTWYGLAVTLLGVYLAFALTRLRRHA